MQDYRAYILGPDGHIQIALTCVATMMARPSGSPSSSLMVATSSYGNWIARSGRSNTRPKLARGCP